MYTIIIIVANMYKYSLFVQILCNFVCRWYDTINLFFFSFSKEKEVIQEYVAVLQV